MVFVGGLRCIDVTLEARSPPDLLLAMCNPIFGKGQQAMGAGQDGVRRGLTYSPANQPKMVSLNASMERLEGNALISTGSTRWKS
jgi:hypothetical protein